MSKEYEFKSTITYMGFEFDFWGEWLPYLPATDFEPDEGGYFNDYEIKLNDKLIEDVLSDETISTIIAIAESEYVDRYLR